MRLWQGQRHGQWPGSDGGPPFPSRIRWNGRRRRPAEALVPPLHDRSPTHPAPSALVPVRSRSACPFAKCLSICGVPVHSRGACPFARCLSIREVPVHWRSACPFVKCLSNCGVPVHSRSACPLAKCLSNCGVPVPSRGGRPCARCYFPLMCGDELARASVP